MPVMIRPASEGDLEPLRALLIGFTEYASEVPLDVYRQRLLDRLADPAWCLRVAESEGGLIGYAIAQDYGPNLRCTFTTGRVEDLYVDPKSRLGGIGRALMNAIFDWARSRPEPMILDWQASPGADVFYERLGFEADRVGDQATFPGFCLDLREGRSQHAG